jgi:Superinfection immunity protein
MENPDNTLIVILLLGIAVLLCLALVCSATYLLPSVVAFKRGHENAWVILVLNLLFGFTLIGWWGCLAWAMAGKTRDEKGNPMWVPQQNRFW